VPEIKEVDDINQDDMGRLLGYYVYRETKVWFEDGKVHRADGPAVVSPDGVERWYINGTEITMEVRVFFAEHKWNVKSGLNKPEKLAAFQAAFCK
jgi:hypothetical protein